MISTKLPGIMKEFGVGNGVIYVDRPEDVIDVVLKLSNEPKRLQDIRKNAYNFVKGFSWTKTTDRFELLLERVIDNQKMK